MSTKPDDAKTTRFRFSEPMQPCPKCGSFNIRYQTPIKVGDHLPPGELTPRNLLRTYALALKDGGFLEGPCFIMCFGCGHKGPSVDCSGQTSEDVGRDPVVARKIRELWNSQEGF